MGKNSLKFKIPFFIMIFATSCVLVTGLLFQYIAVENIETNTLNKNLMISRMISNQIAIYMEDAQSTVNTAASFSSQSNGNMEEIQKEIFRIYDNFPYFDLIFYMNAEARMVFSKPSNDHIRGRSYYDRSYYWDTIMGNQSTVSPLLISSVLNETHFIIAAPVYNHDGETIGLIGAGLPLRNIEKIIENNQEHFDGKMWITDEEGILAVYPGVKNLGELVELENRDVFANNRRTDLIKILEDKKEVIGNYTYRNDDFYGAITFVPNLNWMVVVEQDTETIFAEVVQLKNQLRYIIVFVILIAFILGFIWASRIIGPIDLLVKKVRKLDYGLNNIRPINIQLNTKDEIGELGKAFNDMTVQLEKNIHELNESYIRESNLQQYLNNILESVGIGIVVMDRSGSITIFNKAAEAISEFNANAFINKDIAEFFHKTKLSAGDMVKDSINENKVFQDMEVTMESSSGREVFISLVVSKALDKTKDLIGYIFLFRDISQIKMIEEELKREDRIRTLGELSASIIHDIGNPLAGIGNLVEIISADDFDDENKKEVLSVLQEEIRDLNRLVIDFLRFIRNTKLDEEETNISELMNGIIYLLKSHATDKQIDIKKAYSNDALFLRIDRRGIKQALINILKNAIEAVPETGRIEVEIKRMEKFMVISIKDDGTGIDQRELEKIFDPFYTTRKEGTGLGLSIAYNIIKAHRGYIDIKSQKHIGTEVCVNLPLNSTYNDEIV